MEAIFFVLLSTIAGSLFKHYLEPVVLNKAAYLFPQYNIFNTKPETKIEPTEFNNVTFKRTINGYTTIYVSSPTRTDTTYVR